ncbi:MAG: amidohydrolase [Candidatus Bathyarchaeia archaeon]
MGELPEELFADLVLLNGKIVTVNEKETIAEAVAAKGGKILKVGSTEEIKKTVGKHTKVIDLKGKTVLPGFVDCHNHVPARVGGVDLHWVRSMDELVEKLREQAEKTPKGRWITGGGFNESKLKEKRFPNRYDLDRVSTEHPVVISRVGGHHGGIYNSYTLNLAGITKDTPDPEPPGYIERDPVTREPLGNLRESAEAPMRRLRMQEPRLPEEERRAATKEALKETFQQLLAWGITSVLDPGIGGDTLEMFQELLEEGELPIRISFLVGRGGITRTGPEGVKEKIQALSSIGLKPGFGNDWLRFVGLKLMTDGSMSAATCALYEPYVGQPDNYGIFHEAMGTKEEFTDYVTEAHKAGIRVGVHAIGDKAIDVTLDAIEAAQKAYPREDLRHSIEHCGLPTKKALERMKRLGVTASASVGFGWELGDQHRSLIGPERMEGYYPMKSFKEYGIKAGANFDYSVTMADTAKGLYVMVARRSEMGQDLGQSQRISRMDAIRALTIDSAYLQHEEGMKGSIEPGKLADMVVLDRDILTCPEEEIKDITVLTTILGGEVKYQKK